jgi:xanthine dehydrogenase accessory factor
MRTDLLLIHSGVSTLLRITPDPTPGDEPVVAESEGLVTVANPCLSGGTLDIFLEAVLPPALVYVFGDTPVAHAMGTVGASLGYQVMEVTDPATPVPGDTRGVVVASHGRDEEPVLRAALDAGVPYVAMVASRKRAAGVLADMGLSGDLTADDPVCGMQVAVVADAVTYEHAGRTWYLCAPGCRTAFAEAPERYGA